MTVTTAQRTVEAGGRSWTCCDSGTGEPVLVLDPAGERASLEVFDALTGHRRVITVELSSSDDVAELAALLRELDIEHCAVIARGSAAAAALRLAAERDDLIDTLVLESPELDAALVEAMPSITAPTLVLLGQRTEAATPSRAGAYKRLPGSTVGLVYDAGVDIRGDRPSAYLSAVSDYLERGQAFVVNTRSSVING